MIKENWCHYITLALISSHLVKLTYHFQIYKQEVTATENFWVIFFLQKSQLTLSIRMQKYVENCSFYVLKVLKIWHKIVTFCAQNILDSLPTLKMHLIINNALLWYKKVLYWRDLEIVKGAGLVLRPTTVRRCVSTVFVAFYLELDNWQGNCAESVDQYLLI